MGSSGDVVGRGMGGGGCVSPKAVEQRNKEIEIEKAKEDIFNEEVFRLQKEGQKKLAIEKQLEREKKESDMLKLKEEADKRGLTVTQILSGL